MPIWVHYFQIISWCRWITSLPQTCKNFINDSLANWNVHDIIVFYRSLQNKWWWPENCKSLNKNSICYVLNRNLWGRGRMRVSNYNISDCHQVVVLSRVGQDKISYGSLGPRNRRGLYFSLWLQNVTKTTLWAVIYQVYHWNISGISQIHIRYISSISQV